MNHTGSDDENSPIYCRIHIGLHTSGRPCSARSCPTQHSMLGNTSTESIRAPSPCHEPHWIWFTTSFFLGRSFAPPYFRTSFPGPLSAPSRPVQTTTKLHPTIPPCLPVSAHKIQRLTQYHVFLRGHFRSCRGPVHQSNWEESQPPPTCLKIWCMQFGRISPRHIPRTSPSIWSIQKWRSQTDSVASAHC